MKKLLAALTLGLCLVAVSAQATSSLYAIYWLSNVQPCQGNAVLLGVQPVYSTFYNQCESNGYFYSDCRTTYGVNPTGMPWDMNNPITIVGYSLTMELTQPTANGVALVSMQPATPGAFAKTAGVGTNNTTVWFPAGVGISVQSDPLFPSNTEIANPGLNGSISAPHINPTDLITVYAACDGNGSFAVYYSIYYTSP